MRLLALADNDGFRWTGPNGHQHVCRETDVGGTRVVGVFGHALLDV